MHEVKDICMPSLISYGEVECCVCITEMIPCSIAITFRWAMKFFVYVPVLFVRIFIEIVDL